MSLLAFLERPAVGLTGTPARLPFLLTDPDVVRIGESETMIGLALRPGDAAATREERERCWEARDAYYSCLDAVGVVKPGSETSRQCRAEGKVFSKNCAKSWVRADNSKCVYHYAYQLFLPSLTLRRLIISTSEEY